MKDWLYGIPICSFFIISLTLAGLPFSISIRSFGIPNDPGAYQSVMNTLNYGPELYMLADFLLWTSISTAFLILLKTKILKN